MACCGVLPVFRLIGVNLNKSSTVPSLDVESHDLSTTVHDTGLLFLLPSKLPQCPT